MTEMNDTAVLERRRGSAPTSMNRCSQHELMNSNMTLKRTKIRYGRFTSLHFHSLLYMFRGVTGNTATAISYLQPSPLHLPFHSLVRLIQIAMLKNMLINTHTAKLPKVIP